RGDRCFPGMNALPRSVFALAVLSVVGCSAGSTILARNPLSGDGGSTLSATRPPKSDTFQLAKDMIVKPDACAAPVDDAIQVAISKDEVCVRTARSELLAQGNDASSLASKVDAV